MIHVSEVDAFPRKGYRNDMVRMTARPEQTLAGFYFARSVGGAGLFHVRMSAMDDLAAAVHARLDAIESALHRKVDALLQGIHHLISRGDDMSQISDTLNTLSSEIGTLASDNGTKTATLVGYKDENDSALSGAVSTLTSARDALKSTSADLDQAIAAHQDGSAPVVQPGTVSDIDPATGLPRA